MSLRFARLLTVLVTATGFLGVAVPAHADDAHRPAVNCNPPVQHPVEFAAVFSGEAHAAVGHPDVVSVTVHCSYFGFNVDYYHHASAEGPVVVFQQVGGFYFDLFDTVCQSAEAVYADGHVAMTPESCRPILAVQPDVGPLPGSVTEPVLRCDVNRGPSVTDTWLVAVVGVAGVRADVALSTRVSCTLYAANGEATAGATAVGGAAAASNAVPLDVASLVKKCATIEVEYLVSGTATAGFCESIS